MINDDFDIIRKRLGKPRFDDLSKQMFEIGFDLFRFDYGDVYAPGAFELLATIDDIDKYSNEELIALLGWKR